MELLLSCNRVRDVNCFLTVKRMKTKIKIKIKATIGMNASLNNTKTH